jgi:hypothetical protein
VKEERGLWLQDKQESVTRRAGEGRDMGSDKYFVYGDGDWCETYSVTMVGEERDV